MEKKAITFNPADFEPVRRIALTFPGAEDSVSHYDTPSVKVAGKLMCRLHETEGFVAVRLETGLREAYLEKYPEIFLLPAHYRAYPFLCLWPRKAGTRLLQEVLARSWEGLATEKLKKLRAESSVQPGS